MCRNVAGKVVSGAGTLPSTHTHARAQKSPPPPALTFRLTASPQQLPAKLLLFRGELQSLLCFVLDSSCV